MDTSLTYDDVLIVPQYSELVSRKGADTSVEIGHVKLNVPILASNMSNVISEELCMKLAESGGIAVVDQFRSITGQVQIIENVKSKKLHIAGATGVTKDFKERAEALVVAGVDIVVFDTPHAHSILAKSAVSWCRRKFPNVLIACGNVVTPEGTKMLIDAGADIIKVGVGPGSACITRVVAGVGVPQFTAVSECAKVARKYGKFIIADGGVKTAGAFAKAIAIGADTVMMGNVFAGCDEAPSEFIVRDGRKYKSYFGSASAEAKRVRNAMDPAHKVYENEFVEGVSGLVPYRGSVSGVMMEYQMGLKSAMSYSNARTVRVFQANARFTRVTSIGERENNLDSKIEPR
jgi:IMP dehydrogenase